MSVREVLNEHARAASFVVATVLLIVVTLAFTSFRSAPLRPVAAETPEKLFFTSDDGKTYFVDDGSKLAPFDFDGHTAYQAIVFQCGNAKPFVG